MDKSQAEISIFRCPNGHGLGLIRRDASGTACLMLYRHAINLADADPAQVDVIAVIDAASDIQCDICESTRRWAPSRKVLEKLAKSL